MVGYLFNFIFLNYLNLIDYMAIMWQYGPQPAARLGKKYYSDAVFNSKAKANFLAAMSRADIV